MKDEKKGASKKLTFFCYVAIILSVVAILCTFIRIIPEQDVTTDGFIGAIATFIGICVTFVIGFQIFSTLDIKDSVKDIKNFEQELSVTKEEMYDLFNGMRADFFNNGGLEYRDKEEYVMAFCYYVRGIFHALKCKDSHHIKTLLHNAEVLMNAWEGVDEEKALKCTYTVKETSPVDFAQNVIEDIVNNCSDDMHYDRYEPRISGIKSKYETIINRAKQNADAQ